MFEVNLPWPPPTLSPNDRSHWTRKAESKVIYRRACGMLAKTIRPKFGDGEINVGITFYPPTKGRRDLDNMLASMKSGLDALAMAWGVDDSRFAIILRRGDPEKGGRVNVKVWD